ncbi:hypothetical protein AND4_19682, partial [Vibrio sp. AND4]
PVSGAVEVAPPSEENESQEASAQQEAEQSTMPKAR